MNYKKVGLGIALSTAMSFMACGDDSSNPISNNTDNIESSSSVDGGAPKSSPSEKSSSSVAGNVSSSSVAPSSSSVVEAEPCTFAATDNLWEMSYKASNSKGNANVKTIYKINHSLSSLLFTIF